MTCPSGNTRSYVTPSTLPVISNSWRHVVLSFIVA
ncbi:unnamed protein product [Timema podura]|uniref:Uncharacterized protein n=1 Tax=Timema podura TaxID=61482 RepID=A0ABN7PIE0_TIMPD|nr:unnamed protein product [Timema podura]